MNYAQDLEDLYLRGQHKITTVNKSRLDRRYLSLKLRFIFIGERKNGLSKNCMKLLAPYDEVIEHNGYMENR